MGLIYMFIILKKTDCDFVGAAVSQGKVKIQNCKITKAQNYMIFSWSKCLFKVSEGHWIIALNVFRVNNQDPWPMTVLNWSCHEQFTQ